MSEIIYPPVEIPQIPIVASFFTVNISSVVLNTSANITVVFYNENEIPLTTKYLVMEGEDYKAWGTNDNYPIEWVRMKLQLPPYV